MFCGQGLIRMLGDWILWVKVLYLSILIMRMTSRVGDLTRNGRGLVEDPTYFKIRAR